MALYTSHEFQRKKRPRNCIYMGSIFKKELCTYRRTQGTSYLHSKVFIEARGGGAHYITEVLETHTTQN